MSNNYTEAEMERQREEYDKLRREAIELLKKNGYGAEFKSVWKLH